MEKLVEKIKKAWSFLIYILTLKINFKGGGINSINSKNVFFGSNTIFFDDVNFNNVNFNNIFSDNFDDSNETPLTSLHTPNSQFYNDYY
jgi:hypothetical protein